MKSRIAKKARTEELAVGRSAWRPTPALYTVKQAAMFLNVSSRTIFALLKRGELKRRKVGSKTLIPVTSLEEFVKRDHRTD